MAKRKRAPTTRQMLFVQEYLISLNATEAMIKAGYSEKWANGAYSQMMNSPYVRGEIAKHMDARTKRTSIDADWVLTRLAEEAEADLLDIYDDNGKLKAMKDWPPIWRKGLVSGVKATEDGDNVVINEIKLSERIKRLELIGRHVDVQAWLDKTQNVEQKTEEEMYERLINLLGGDSSAKAVVDELFGKGGDQGASTRH